MGSDSVSIHQYDANFARVGQRKVHGLFFLGFWHLSVGLSNLLPLIDCACNGYHRYHKSSQTVSAAFGSSLRLHWGFSHHRMPIPAV